MSDLKEYKLSILLNEVLGPGIVKNDESIHQCPFCSHHKPKFQVSLSNRVFHCWVCDKKGRSIAWLLKNQGASQSQLKRLNDLFPESIKKVIKDEVFNPFASEINLIPEDKISLPSEFIPLCKVPNSTNRNIRFAFEYLKNRGINKNDIIKHNIGYCEYGDYKDRIIIPSYDENGVLNFFTGRAMYDNMFLTYKNPSFSKNIVGFELFINWNEPIVICEGPMDAISVKRNAIPLFGKTIPEILRLRILEKRVKSIYLALDKDALSSSLKITKNLKKMGDIKIFVPIFEEKDPNKLGFKKVEEILNKTSELDFFSFVGMKLKI